MPSLRELATWGTQPGYQPTRVGMDVVPRVAGRGLYNLPLNLLAAARTPFRAPPGQPQQTILPDPYRRLEERVPWFEYQSPEEKLIGGVGEAIYDPMQVASVAKVRPISNLVDFALDPAPYIERFGQAGARQMQKAGNKFWNSMNRTERRRELAAQLYEKATGGPREIGDMIRQGKVKDFPGLSEMESRFDDFLQGKTQLDPTTGGILPKHYVKVDLPDGQSMYDQILSKTPEQALDRARKRWPGAQDVSNVGVMEYRQWMQKQKAPPTSPTATARPQFVQPQHGAGGVSAEELSRPGVFVRISKGGKATYLGKQPGAEIQLGPQDAIVRIQPTGEVLVQRSNLPDKTILEKYKGRIDKLKRDIFP